MTIGRSRRAADTMLAAAAVLLVIAGAASAGALYYYHASLPPPGSNEAVVQAPQTPVGSTSSVASSGSSTAISTSELASSAACADGGLANNTAILTAFAGELASLIKLNYTTNDLFGNFSEMAVSLQTSINGSSLGEYYSYNVVGRPVINSVEYYEVNFTSSSTFGGDVNGTAVFAPDGNATSITATLPIGDWNGSSAAPQGQAIISPFLAELQTTINAKATMSSWAAMGLKVLNETTVSLGPTSVGVTYYTPTTLPISLCGSTVTNEVVGVGTAPGSNIPLTLYSDFGVTEQGTATGILETVTSLAVASP